MDFNFIDEIVLNIEVNLIPLRKTSLRYSILMYQHAGSLIANNDRIGNDADVEHLFDTFFQKAIEESSDLVLSPEYSCPWNSIQQIIDNPEGWPADGKLWVIGCESLTSEALSQFQVDNSHDDKIIYCDPSVLNSKGNYVDPLVYLFQIVQDGVVKLMILIQFKTHHMGVWGTDIERNNLIPGSQIFILRNSPQSVYLFSLICSDVLNFEADFTQDLRNAVDWEDRSFLIFNPQCNPGPSHDGFISFRKFLFRHDDKELITLNWNKTTELEGNKLIPGNCSRSGIYLKSSEINTTKARITGNHSKGVYYFNNGRHRHTFLLNSAVDVFHIGITPVSISPSGAAEPQIRKDGPEIMDMYLFNGEGNLAAEDDISDYHVDYVKEVGCTNEFLQNTESCIIDKERLVSLSSGRITRKATKLWWQVDYIPSIKMDVQTETICRITYSEDYSEPSVEQRERYVDAIISLEQILANDLLAKNLRHLQQVEKFLGYSGKSEGDSFKYNVIDGEGNGIATIVYVGSALDEKIGKIFSILQGMFDNDNKNRAQVVVYYRRGPNLEWKEDVYAANIQSTNNYGEDSILKK